MDQCSNSRRFIRKFSHLFFLCVFEKKDIEETVLWETYNNCIKLLIRRMSHSHTHPQQQQQTTVFFGGSNGTKTLLALLGDKSNNDNVNHTLRVVTRNPDNFLNITTTTSNNNVEIQRWRCNEQVHISNTLSASFLPTQWITHEGQPDSVFSYDDDDIDAAISGSSLSSNKSCVVEDNGGQADVLLLCCPVYAHLDILRKIARSLYRLDSQMNLNKKRALLIGTVYSAGGFDWMCRLAFHLEKPPKNSNNSNNLFQGWQNFELGLFGLRSFPFLTKSLEKGKVTLYGRFPDLGIVVSPAKDTMRDLVIRNVCVRILQGNQTVGKVQHSFVGLNDSPISIDPVASSSTMMKDAAVHHVVNSVKASSNKTGASSTSSTHHHHHTSQPLNSTSINNYENEAHIHHVRDWTDMADPYSTLGFLSCTLNATNQFLHPCIILSLFGNSENKKEGSLKWPLQEKLTPLPRFYADGASHPYAGKLIVNSACEYSILIGILDEILAPKGTSPISDQYGGEPIGKWFLKKLNNGPKDIAERTGLMDQVMFGVSDDTSNSQSQSHIKNSQEVYHLRRLFEWCMHKGLSNNSRLGGVLSPAYRDPQNSDYVKPILNSRFFIDDIPHGLCIMLGLCEMLGFDLERDTPITLQVVRTLQTWMGKEFVKPKNEQGANTDKGNIVGGARDLKETSAPQAFGIWNIQQLRNFLNLDPFAENSVEVSLNQLQFQGEALSSSKL